MSDLPRLTQGPRDLARHATQEKRKNRERIELELDDLVERLERAKTRLGARWKARHEKRLQNAKDELARIRSL